MVASLRWPSSIHVPLEKASFNGQRKSQLPPPKCLGICCCMQGTLAPLPDLDVRPGQQQLLQTRRLPGSGGGQQGPRPTVKVLSLGSFNGSHDPISQSIIRSINQSINQSIKQSASQSINNNINICQPLVRGFLIFFRASAILKTVNMSFLYPKIISLQSWFFHVSSVRCNPAHHWIIPLAHNPNCLFIMSFIISYHKFDHGFSEDANNNSKLSSQNILSSESISGWWFVSRVENYQISTSSLFNLLGGLLLANGKESLCPCCEAALESHASGWFFFFFHLETDCARLCTIIAIFAQPGRTSLCFPATSSLGCRAKVGRCFMKSTGRSRACGANRCKT